MLIFPMYFRLNRDYTASDITLLELSTLLVIGHRLNQLALNSRLFSLKLSSRKQMIDRWVLVDDVR